MLKNLILYGIATISLSAFDYNLHPKKVAEDIYCFFGKLENISMQNGGNMVNTCYVQTKEGYVVIDSGPTYSYALQAYSSMQQISKLPVKYVINTHDHDDHWLGNSFYKKQNAFLIGPETYAKNIFFGMKTRMQRMVGSEIFSGTTIVKLDKIVKQYHKIQVGKTLFEIKQLVSQAHTKGDLIVYLPQKKVLFAGDLVFNDRVTSLRDGSLIGSLRALDLIDELRPNVIVGGHGYRTDANATQAFKGYLLDMKTEILDALDNNIPIEEITKKIQMPAYKNLKLYNVLHRRNVFDAYRELEMYDEDEIRGEKQ
ncbi:MAG: MBL fold metallo-hydrolase [Sulfurovum sp.]|nr:MBL fold metallo-hydrolase [Sulfurovum sp.]MCB4763355.1 MBL fold metallo-hydrolase [Sulfurovum sp.]MCB4774964.1 MBL fold metallo-hydrolase [Sulfurovum sp.]